MGHKDGIILVLAFLVIFVASALHAEWPGFGTPVCTREGQQSPGTVIADGVGGAIIVWMDWRNGDSDIYAQRLDENGAVLWRPDGVAVVATAGDQYEVQAVSDSSGGSIITWRDERSGQSIYHIYAQRMDETGNTLWAQDGVPVCDTGNNQYAPQIVSDDLGGAVIAWTDYAEPGPAGVYAQRVGPDGNALWAAEGLRLCVADGGKALPQVVAGAEGSFVFAWIDARNGSDWRDIFAQRVQLDGTLLWETAGVPLCVTPGNKQSLQLVSDETGGAYAAWVDFRYGNDNYYADIYAQRIDSSGAALWTATGLSVCGAVNSQLEPRLACDNLGNAMFIWSDLRDGSQWDIYAQKVAPDGSILWRPNGAPVSKAVNHQQSPALTSDGDGGFVAVWADRRNSEDVVDELDIYGQRIDSSGTPSWSTTGVPICVARGYQTTPLVMQDAQAGVYVAWCDQRASTGQGGVEQDIFAQLVSENGTGTFAPSPTILTVTDVPRDQGGFLSVQWRASSFDYAPNTVITHYSIWRSVARIDANSAMASMGKCVDLKDVGKSFQGPAFMVRSYAGVNYVWEWLDNREAHYFDNYAYTASTLYDSTQAGTGYHYFLVAAHTDDPFVFWDSAPDSGYSVDNLAPHIPQGLAGHYESAPDFLSLHWHANTESDLSGYRVYRGEGPGFVPTEDNLIAATPDTVASGLSYYPVDPWYIKVSAVDIHGNESGFALLPPEYVTIATLVSSYQSAWVHGSVEISWAMTGEGAGFEFHVSRKVGADGTYDELSGDISASGNERSFRDATVEPGKTYWYRVLILDQGQPVTSFETSITTPPYELALYQNYPNPFNPSTTINFTLDAEGSVSLRIYDISGRLVRTLVDGVRPAKSYTEEWDGRDDAGNETASGVYFVRLTVGSRTLTRKAVLVR